ncbi:MAG: hypothetical protein ACK6A9_00600 [Dolichospermum sp.]
MIGATPRGQGTGNREQGTGTTPGGQRKKQIIYLLPITYYLLPIPYSLLPITYSLIKNVEIPD